MHVLLQVFDEVHPEHDGLVHWLECPYDVTWTCATGEFADVAAAKEAHGAQKDWPGGLPTCRANPRNP